MAVKLTGLVAGMMKVIDVARKDTTSGLIIDQWVVVMWCVDFADECSDGKRLAWRWDIGGLCLWNCINIYRQANGCHRRFQRSAWHQQEDAPKMKGLTIFRPPSTEIIALSIYPPAALESSSTGPKIS